MKPPPRAAGADYIGRFREVISDPLNLLIERHPMAGVVNGNEVFLHNGIRVPVAGEGAYYDEFSKLLIVNRGVHEPLQEYIFQELLISMPEAPLMVELGAYWAHYSMWLKKERPRAKVVMVEPNPNNLAAGRANFQRNGFDGQFIQAVVAEGQWQIDPFVRSQGIDRLDILHADIEGFEVDLLNGARETLSRQLIGHLLISTHSQEVHRHIIKNLSNLGYRIEVESDWENDTTSSDGLVFAASPGVKPIFKDFPRLGRARIAASRADELVQSVLNCRNSRMPR